MNKLQKYLLILICFIILIVCINNSQKLSFEENDKNCPDKLNTDINYIDNPYDLFYDPNYTTLYYAPWVNYGLNKPDGYGGTWSLGGSKYYPYHKTYINYSNPLRIISGNRMTRYGGRDPMIPPSVKNN